MRDIVIVEAARTPVGRFRGSFKGVRADHLGAAVLDAVVQRAGLQPGQIDDVVFGAPDSGMNGLAYVVFGAKGDPVERKVADLVLGKGGFALAGPGPDTQSGASVTLVPSVNADELAEVFIGAPGHGVNNEGRAYLVYGGKCEG